MSIRKRGKNYWELVISQGIDPATGKRQRAYYSFRGTEREAEKEHTRLSRQRDLGILVQPSKITLREFMDRFLEDDCRLHVSERTLQGYRDLVRLHIGAHLGDHRLDKLRPIHIQRFYSDRLDRGRTKGREDEEPRGLSPQTVLHMHRLLREGLSVAVKWGLLAVNPADAVTPPKVERQDKITVLSEEETNKLLETAEGTNLHMPILLAVATGLRRGEILALRWSDLDLDAGTVTVSRSLSETKERGLIFKSPKSRSSKRVVSMPSFAVQALKKHRKKQAEHKLALGPGYKDEDLVLPAPDGRPWTPSNLTGAFGALIRRHKLPQVRFHDLRHGHITQLLLRGVPLKVVSARAGHSGIGITADLYGHLLPGADEQAAAQLEDVYRLTEDGSE